MTFPLSGSEIDVLQSSSSAWTCEVPEGADTVTMTLIDVGTGELVNDRDAVDALQNDCELSGTTFRWDIQIADTAVTSLTPIGLHRRLLATFTFEGDGVKFHRTLTVSILRLRSLDVV